MLDVKGVEILENSTIEDSDGRRYLITKEEDCFYANSLFYDSGCKKYPLYPERIRRNGFKVVS